VGLKAAKGITTDQQASPAKTDLMLQATETGGIDAVARRETFVRWQHYVEVNVLCLDNLSHLLSQPTKV